MYDFQHKLTREEINALPLYTYSGPIEIVRNKKQWDKILPELCQNEVIGFDTETKPSFSKGQVNLPALIQLATDRKVFLIQLRRFPFNNEIASFLSKPDILKVGVGITYDMAGLNKIYPFEAQGIVDLSQLSYEHNFQSHGLRSLAATLFGWRISKSSQCSNWDASNLSQKQIIYAATDAWVSREIYLRTKELETNDFVLPQDEVKFSEKGNFGVKVLDLKKLSVKGKGK